MVATARACRLYLTVPARPTADLEPSLLQAFAAADTACVLLTGAAEAVPGWARRLRELTLERDIALLIDNDIEYARSIDADGVHISPDAALYAKARDALGQRAIVGIGCFDNRHNAMAMAELGADYVAFGGDDAARRAETIAWWSEIFVVPCVAWDVETPEEAGRLANAGADFVGLAPSVLAGEDAPTRVAAIEVAMRRARSAA